MSQQKRSNRKPSQQQQAQQGRPMPPQAPPPNYSQPLPPQQQAPQQTQPDKVYVERSTNPLVMVLKAIFYPFIKIFQIIGGAIAIVFQEMVRSLVNFVFGIVLLVLFVAIVGGYIYALFQTDFDFAAAVPEMFNFYLSLIGMGRSGG